MNRHVKITFTCFCTLLLGFMVMPSAQAYDLPSVNLGFTSFVDGGPPAGSGIYITQYVQQFDADKLIDQNGNGLLTSKAREDFTALVSLTQFIYQSEQELLLGGKWGLDVIVPFVWLDMGYGVPSATYPSTGRDDFGDLLVGPFLQWDPIMGDNGPIFMHRVELQMIFPTGGYDNTKAINPGSNFFSFNPYWAGTFFITPHLTVSTRIHYLWNGTNDDPANPDATDDTRAGQAFHANFALAYEVVPQKFRVGLNGYYLKQITESEVDGVDVAGSEEKVFAFGSGFVWHINQNNHLFFNMYFEKDVENRPRGDRYNLRYVYHF